MAIDSPETRQNDPFGQLKEGPSRPGGRPGGYRVAGTQLSGRVARRGLRRSAALPGRWSGSQDGMGRAAQGAGRDG